jgi:transposase
MNILLSVWNTIQDNLFPFFEEILEPLSEKEQQFIQVVTLMNPQNHVSNYKWKGIGRKPEDRLSMLKAFIAKAVYNNETTEMLIENLHNYKNLRRLCGWEYSFQVPSASTFSRVFGQFSEDKLAVRIHEAMITEYCGPKLAGHVSRDSTEIDAREKPAKKEKKEHDDTRPKRKRGRPKKGEVVQPEPLKRLEIQPLRTLEENLADLPEVCDVGTKKDSKGHKTSWIGYKLHIDTIDGDIPVSAVLTSASLHDSQVAVPLAQMTAQRIVNLYDLMDSAYDAAPIKNFCSGLGHVPIIDHNPRRGEKMEMSPAAKTRYAQRSSAERVNSDLKDNHGGSRIRVRGSAKIMTQLMFGLIVITAAQLIRLIV